MSVDPALLPSDEDERLEAVLRYNVLDSPPDGAFDRVTALAARHFDVPIAIVTIVDTDRIWFKSRHGLEVDEIGRDPGLRASAILHDDPWIVEQADRDPRTLANPLVAGEFGLRFYAGAPLTTHDGHNLGTLCVIDREPREMSDEDSDTLRDLAAIVMDELELRLAARTVVDREQTLRTFAERTARALQASLLPPELPALAAADLGAFYEPARDAEVAGDFYDVFPVGAEGFALVVGDVSGKGPPAAAVTALVRHTIRTASMTTDDPAAVLRTVNDAMFLGQTEGDLAHYCTVHLTFVTPLAGALVLRSAAAGHPPGLVLRAGSETLQELPAFGPPVGWYKDPSFASTEVTLDAGDVLVLHTDGLTEARQADGSLLGEAGIGDVLRRCQGKSSPAIAEAVQAMLHEPGVDVRDDTAVLVVQAR
ncbi:MAG: putative magnesium or manganese-dependent protein phosphatase [Solirubrobacterales bacterium]|nr:putative magnesium or manganese-dependent protein phosphatase [Solirubrobacterales bacterium]